MVYPFHIWGEDDCTCRDRFKSAYEGKMATAKALRGGTTHFRCYDKEFMVSVVLCV